jgi:hypothetical protein
MRETESVTQGGLASDFISVPYHDIVGLHFRWCMLYLPWAYNTRENGYVRSFVRVIALKFAGMVSRKHSACVCL